jgi:hypothetical protein
MWSILRKAGYRMAQRLENEWGDPIYRDAQIRVWDTQAVGTGRPRYPGASIEGPDDQSPGLSSEALDG